MLSDLLRGNPGEPAGLTGLSGLSSLVRGAVSGRMTLVEAMNALDRGEIERPVNGAFGELLDPAELPMRPAPAPKRHPVDDVVDEMQKQAAIDRDEMRIRIARKRDQVNANPVYSKDELAVQADATQRHQRTRRLDEAAAQLER